MPTCAKRSPFFNPIPIYVECGSHRGHIPNYPLDGHAYCVRIPWTDTKLSRTGTEYNEHMAYWLLLELCVQVRHLL